MVAFVTPVVEHWMKMRNSSMGQPWGIDPTTHCTMSGCFTMELHFTKVLFFDISVSSVGKQNNPLMWFTQCIGFLATCWMCEHAVLATRTFLVALLLDGKYA